jgi:hypothetical protein
MSLSPEATIIETLFQIPTKEGEDVEFKLNSAQRRLDSALTGRDLVPKARQEGVSSYYLARFLAACLMYRNTRAVVISHDMESTQRLLGRVHYYIENFRGPKPVTSRKSTNEIAFPKTGSTFWIGTAGSRKFGRGDTITHLHCSEYAFWINPKELMKGLLQAVPMGGEIGIESTGNGFNDYHRQCMRAYQGRSIWTLHFLPWHTFEEYRVDLSPEEEKVFLDNLVEEWEEPELHAQGLTAQQLAWRRMKLDELEYDLTAFKQEYPMTLDECFQMSSESVFHRVNYEATARWEKIDTGLWILEGHPSSVLHYTLGGDVGGGVGKDASVVEVFCLETNEQVAEYTSNRVDPELFAHKVAGLGRRFNMAFSTIEQNNHGILTLAILVKIYPRLKIRSDPATKTNTEEKRLFNLGYRTTGRNKPLMIGNLRTLLASEWTIHSPLLKNQLSTFIETDGGKLEAQQGCEDDTVIAAACAASGRNKASMLAAAEKRVVEIAIEDPFSLDAIIKELSGRGSEWPIAPQHIELPEAY